MHHAYLLLFGCCLLGRQPVAPPPADMTLPAFCLGAEAAPLLDGGRPGAAAPLLLFDPEAAHEQAKLFTELWAGC